MTPTDALRLVEAQPPTLSTGQSLSQTLDAIYGLKSGEADWLVTEYQHFIALALSAAEDEVTMPSPLIERLWQTHQDDPSYADFAASLAPAKLTHHHAQRRHARNPSYKATRARYHAAFGKITPRWWPSPWWLWAVENPFALLVFALVVIYELALKSDPATALYRPTKHGAKLLISVMTGVLLISVGRKATPLARMTTPRASYAQSPKATP